jgi:predicted CopG family antitoxin
MPAKNIYLTEENYKYIRIKQGRYKKYTFSSLINKLIQEVREHEQYTRL